MIIGMYTLSKNNRFINQTFCIIINQYFIKSSYCTLKKCILHCKWYIIQFCIIPIYLFTPESKKNKIFTQNTLATYWHVEKEIWIYESSWNLESMPIFPQNFDSF